MVSSNQVLLHILTVIVDIYSHIILHLFHRTANQDFLWRHAEADIV